MMYDRYRKIEEDSEDWAHFRENISKELIANIDDEEATELLDDLYFEDQFLIANELYDEADDLFDQADATGERADVFQLVMLVYAVGLSLAAWGSLAKEGSKISILFGTISLVAFIFGTFLWLNLLITSGGIT